MNILFISIGRFRNIEEKGVYTDLLRQFRDNGNHVFIVTPLEKRTRLISQYKYEKGVYVLRVRTGNITKTHIFEKVISTLTLEYLFLMEIKRYLAGIRFDLIIYSTPPITIEKVIKYIKARDGAKTYLLLKDIFPQNAVDLHLLSKKNPLYWFFRRKEKKLYMSSDYIGCMSLANVKYLLKHNLEIPRDIVEVCPNSIGQRNFYVDHISDKDIKGKYRIPADKTIFVFGGNLGKPQGIDFAIKCLRANADNERVYFVIAGSGTEHKKLQDYFNKEKPINVSLLGQLPQAEYDLLIAVCDVGLIFLDYRFTIPNFPSRLLSYMQAAIPVLAATDPSTDIGTVIENGQFGLWCESNNVEGFNEKVRQLCNADLRKQMGANAKKYLENNYTARHSYEIIIRHFVEEEGEQQCFQIKSY